VKEYRAFFLSQDGHVFKAEGFEASGDGEATQKAQRLVDGHDVEVWQLARKVGSIKSMAKEWQSEKEDKSERTEQARRVAEEYANGQREIINRLRKPQP